MSEYQYYEFIAVDRPLSERDQRELRARRGDEPLPLRGKPGGLEAAPRALEAPERRVVVSSA
jgi:hypothetical protein